MKRRWTTGETPEYWTTDPLVNSTSRIWRPASQPTARMFDALTRFLSIGDP